MAGKQRSWEKRLAAQPDELTVNYVESLSYDRRLYKYDIVGSIAHAQMLAECKLITKAEFKAIKDGLIEIVPAPDQGGQSGPPEDTGIRFIPDPTSHEPEGPVQIHFRGLVQKGQARRRGCRGKERLCLRGR